jgi:transcriptional regulator GlxA family with amidase domain
VPNRHMNRYPEEPPVRVTLLAVPETTPTTLYGFLEVFSAVGTAWRELTGETTPGIRGMEARIVARTAGPFASPLGPPIAPHEAIADAAPADIVIVTDLALSADAPPHCAWHAEADWLREQFETGATVCAVCTGAVLLAEAGLLDGIEATTHWGAADLFRAHYPKVVLRPERILCPAGPEHRLVTGGGAGSWEDLALYLIARFCGPEEAVRIAKVFVLGDRSDGQLVFSALGRGRSHDDAVIGDCQSWIAEHYAHAHPVRRMVARSGLSERTFKRRFKAATGYAPVEYVQALRIEEAKQLLETTRDPPDDIAHAVGYGDPAFFRRLFKRRTGVTPARYRQHFAGLAGGAA